MMRSLASVEIHLSSLLVGPLNSLPRSRSLSCAYHWPVTECWPWPVEAELRQAAATRISSPFTRHASELWLLLYPVLSLYRLRGNKNLSETQSPRLSSGEHISFWSCTPNLPAIWAPSSGISEFCICILPARLGLTAPRPRMSETEAPRSRQPVELKPYMGAWDGDITGLPEGSGRQ